jgi:hypothetical protein
MIFTPSHAWLLEARHRTRWTLKLVGKHAWFTATPKKVGNKSNQNDDSLLFYLFGGYYMHDEVFWVALNHLLSGGSKGPTLQLGM